MSVVPSVVNPQSCPPVVSPVFSRAHNQAVFRGGLPMFWFAPEGDPNPNPPTPPAPQKSVAEQVKEAIAELLGAKGGDKDAALETLIRKNHKLEVRAETAENALAEAKKQTFDEKTTQELAAWRELGESPDKVKTLLETGQSAIAEGAKAKRSNALRESNFDPEKVNALAGASDWEIISKETTQDGKTVTVHTVKDGDKEKPISEFLTEKFPSLVDSLKLAAPGPKVLPMGRTAPMGGGKAQTLAEQIRAEEAAAKAKSQPKAPEGAAPVPQGLDALKANMGVIRN